MKFRNGYFTKIDLMKVAIIDCGTNTFNLLIAENHDDQWKHLYRNKRVVKLGSGGIIGRVIAEEPVNKAVEALKAYKKIIVKHKVAKTLIVGTSAIRDAKNRYAFLEKVKKETGFSIQLITGATEAKLIYKGVCEAIIIGEETSLILDIGGGSVEFIICNDKKIYWKKSFRLGAARLIEKIQPSDPIQLSEIKKLNTYLNENLIGFGEAVAKFKPKKLIGSSGSFDTFAALILNKTEDLNLIRSKTQYQFNLKEYKTLHKELVKSTYRERLIMKGMLRMRADMIVVSSLLLTFALSKTGIRKLHLSTYALKEGLLMSIQ